MVSAFAAYDQKEKDTFKTYYGKNSVTKEKYTIDIGYERFLGPEMFFHPEFLDGKWRSPIDEIIDKSIQASPVDCRKKLY